MGGGVLLQTARFDRHLVRDLTWSRHQLEDLARRRLEVPTQRHALHCVVSSYSNAVLRSMCQKMGRIALVQIGNYGFGSKRICCRSGHPAMSLQGASLAASEHLGTITGEHMSASGDAREPPDSPFDALFGKVCLLLGLP